MDSASYEISSNEFPDLKSWFSSPSVVISLLFMIGSKEILVLKSQIFGPLELVRGKINCKARSALVSIGGPENSLSQLEGNSVPKNARWGLIKVFERHPDCLIHECFCSSKTPRSMASKILLLVKAG